MSIWAMFVNKYFLNLVTLLAATLLFGCANVPPESVTLSKNIGLEITKSQAAHLSTLDAFYKMLSENNDKWVTDIYLPKLINTAVSDLSVACKKSGDTSLNCSQLNNNDMKRILLITIEFRDGIQRALSANRDESARLINEHYSELKMANATVTGLLVSIVDVKKATNESIENIGKTTGFIINADKIQSTVNDFLIKASETSVQISDLENSLSLITKLSKK
ncbi:hypothetical protein [Chitinibacter sp. S2-10]|uniref:hypothetical protein n=1 Tax=Chitinibacter sp. S2-10 TaxID=3373597 RepID=UPI0039778EFB